MAVAKTTLGYAIERTFLNKGVQAYLKHVDEHDVNVNNNKQIPSPFAFGHFIEVGNILSKNKKGYLASDDPNLPNNQFNPSSALI